MPQEAGLHRLTWEHAGETVRYALHLPDRVDGAPVVLALHYAGHGEPYYGEGVLTQLIEPGLRKTGAVFIAPDCPGGRWTDEGAEALTLGLLDHVLDSYAVDRERVVVTGYSMGGIGTWHFASKHPQRFSAAVPIAGHPRPAQLDALRAVPLYIIHGIADEILPIEPTDDWVRNAQKQGLEPEYHRIANFTHYQTGRFVGPLSQVPRWLDTVWAAD